MFLVINADKIAFLGDLFEVMISGNANMGFDRFNKSTLDGWETHRFAEIEANLNRFYPI